MVPIVISILFILIIGAAAFFLLRSRPKAKSYGSATTLDRQFVQTKWSEIESTFGLGGVSHFKSSIMEADKLVDYVLKSKGVRGNTFGERLKNSRSKFANYADYNDLWFAHKVRNNIAHESNHDLYSAEAKKAIESYKKALRALGAL